jgi:hypothetical protein
MSGFFSRFRVIHEFINERDSVEVTYKWKSEILQRESIAYVVDESEGSYIAVVKKILEDIIINFYDIPDLKFSISDESIVIENKNFDSHIDIDSIHNTFPSRKFIEQGINNIVKVYLSN